MFRARWPGEIDEHHNGKSQAGLGMFTYLVHLTNRVIDLVRIDTRTSFQPLHVPSLINRILGRCLRVVQNFRTLQQCILPVSLNLF